MEHREKRPRRPWAWISLFVLSLLSGAIWRAEVEWHGWEGLIWIKYFHWAIPASVVLFLVWLAAFSGVRPPWKRATLLAAVAALAATSYFLAHGSMIWRYGRTWWWGDESLIMNSVWYRHDAIWMVAPAIPLGACVIANLFGARPGLARMALCFLMFFSAETLAATIMGLIHHAGGVDFIHTIKSGFIIPSLVFALGIPFLPRAQPLAKTDLDS